MSKAATQERLDFETLGSLAEHSLVASGGDWAAAKELMLRIVMNEPHLYERFIMPLIKSAITQAVTGCSIKTRSQFWGQPQPDRAKADGALLQVGVRNIFDWPLAGGKRLGDASKEVLEAEADYNLRTAETRARNARWYQMIAAKLKAGQTVREKLKPEQLVRLQRRAEKEASSQMLTT